MTRRLLALGLMVLSPLCAEYVIGYDDSTGNPLALLAGLLIFVPLYGAPALLIREVARRYGIGWPGILALAAGFGILQAGVIDQSMFSDSYRQIDYWHQMVGPTWIAALGFGAYPAMMFVAGHMIWSFAIPIALVEALRPELARQPWLRWPGLVVITALYLAAAWLVLYYHLTTERDHASAAQITGCVVAVALLAGLAFTVGRRRADVRDARVPSPVVVGVASLVAALACDFLPSSWWGVAGCVALLTAAGVGVAWLARSRHWSGRHVVALAAAALLARALTAFFIDPLGDVGALAKYAHNAAFAVGVVLLGLWAARTAGHAGAAAARAARAR